MRNGITFTNVKLLILSKEELNHVLFASTHLDVFCNKFIYYKWYGIRSNKNGNVYNGIKPSIVIELLKANKFSPKFKQSKTWEENLLFFLAQHH